MNPRVVFFDFGGTLARPNAMIHEPWRAWVRAAADVGLVLDEGEIRAVNDEADRRYGGEIYRYHGRTADFWSVRDRWAIDRLGVGPKKEEYFDAVQAIFNDDSLVHLYPETPGVLRELRGRGYRLGIISNFTDALPRLLRYHRLEAYFEAVVYSQEVGREKPDRAIFEDALARVHCSPEDALHVGDSWESDYRGAIGAGMNAIWLNREGRPAPSPCVEVRDLGGVFQRV